MTALECAKLIFAGRATITLVDRRSDRNRFMFTIINIADRIWNVYCKEGREWVFMFTVKDDHGEYTRHSMVNDDHPATNAICVLMKMLDDAIRTGIVDYINEKVEILFSKRCCRCGKTLTTPKSIRMHVGPRCAEKLGLA